MRHGVLITAHNNAPVVQTAIRMLDDEREENSMKTFTVGDVDKTNKVAEDEGIVCIDNLSDILCHLENIKAVIFDLDDTLYSEKDYVRSGYKAVAKLLTEVESVEQKLWAAFESGRAAIDEVLKTEGIFTEQLKEKCLQEYRWHIPTIVLYDCVVDILRELTNRNIRIGIITDGRPEGQRAKIKALQLEKYMEYIIVTDELGGVEFRKPNEKAFQIMSKKMGIPFGEMCYVGDNVTKDFVAPEKLGMKSIWFRNLEGLYAKIFNMR